MSPATATRPARIAHPYRDLEVIDERAPRANQLVTGVLALLALLTGWWGIVVALAVQFAVGLTFGRRFCLACAAYFELVQPRLGEGPLEDARAPRFANQIGLTVLTLASVAFAAGLPTAGWVLTALVAGLALLAGITGLCVGCEVHKRLFGVCQVCENRVVRPGAAA